jgi:hypothetical protein
MGIQYRKRDGDRRWVSADRDLVYALPRLLRKALTSFDEFNGTPEVTRESLLRTAESLGKLVVDIIQKRRTKEDLVHGLTVLPAKDMELIGKAFLFVLLGEMRAWVTDAKPKTSGDIELDDCDLGELAEYFAKASFKG